MKHQDSVSAQVLAQANEKIARQVEFEAQAEQAGYVHRTRADAMVDAAVTPLAAELAAFQQKAADLEREIKEVTISFEAAAVAAKAEAAEALAEAHAHAARVLEETVALEREQAAVNEARAVETAIKETIAKERARSTMVSVVKAIGHAARQKAAVDAAVAAMQKKALLSSRLKRAVSDTQHAEEAARAAEEAAIAQQAAIAKSIAATREECMQELEAAVEAEREAAAEGLAKQAAEAEASIAPAQKHLTLRLPEARVCERHPEREPHPHPHPNGETSP